MGSMIAILGVTLVAFVALDAAWISLVALKMFQSTIGPIMRPLPLLAPAMLFYVIYAAGLVFLAIRPALRERSAFTALTNGGALGLVAYATFDLTNLAIIASWTTTLAAVDIVWGTVASSLAAFVGFAFGRRRMA